MSPAVRLACPAKVNLSLRIHGRRPDGFHEISTVMQTIDLCDRLTIYRAAPSAPLGIGVPGGGAPADDSNLVVEAARAFLAALGEPARGYRFELEKRIPSGAGLGGGSSDAAAALVGLQQLRGEPLSARDLQTVAASIGSDVPFFLVGGTVLATGRGELLQPLADVTEAPLTIAVPPVEISTAAIYRSWRGEPMPGRQPPLLPPRARREHLAAWVRGNDLEPVARRLFPQVEGLVAALEPIVRAAFATGPQVSGSGAAVFLVGDLPEASIRLPDPGTQLIRTRSRPRSRPPAGFERAWSVC